MAIRIERFRYGSDFDWLLRQSQLLQSAMVVQQVYCRKGSLGRRRLRTIMVRYGLLVCSLLVVGVTYRVHVVINRPLPPGIQDETKVRILDEIGRIANHMVMRQCTMNFPLNLKSYFCSNVHWGSTMMQLSICLKLKTVLSQIKVEIACMM